MKAMNSIVIAILMCTSTISYCQFELRNAFELSIDYGFSSDYGSGEFYTLNNFGSQVIYVENRSPVRTKNTALSYSRFLNPKNGFKISFGMANYGFNIKGKTNINNTPFKGTYKINYLEWGLSYIRRVPIAQNFKLLIEPGLRYHSDGSPDSDGITIFRDDSFSFSLYSGIETLMIGNNFFANIGLQLKLPVERYDFEFDHRPAFYPYFIGLKIGVNYQF